MTKLHKLFERRAETYAKYSDAIMDAITPSVVAAVIEHLELTPTDIRMLQWTMIGLIDDHLVLQGHIRSPEDIKLLRIPVPMSIVDKASKQEVLKYLTKLEDTLKDDYDEVYGPGLTQELEIIGDDQFDPAALFGGGPIDAPVVDPSDDFSYNDLTEEQQKALELTMLSQGKGKPN